MTGPDSDLNSTGNSDVGSSRPEESKGASFGAVKTGPAVSGRGRYNLGTPEHLLEGLKTIADYNRTLITLASGTLALSATFLKDLYSGTYLWVLIVAWCAFGISVTLGSIGLGQVISQLAESKLRVGRGPLEYLSLLQLLTLLTSIGCLAFFAAVNVQRAEPVQRPPASGANVHPPQHNRPSSPGVAR